MIPIRVEVEKQHIQGMARWFIEPRIARKELSAAIEKGFAAAGEQWYETMLPRHFTPAGASDYGYENRTARYLIRRNKGGKGHPATTNPLTWSGATLAMAKSWRKVVATSTGVRVTFRVPSYIYSSRARANMPNMASELVRATQGELETLAKTAINVATKQLSGGLL